MTAPRPTFVSVPLLHLNSDFSSNNATLTSGSSYERADKHITPPPTPQTRRTTPTRNLQVQYQRRVYHRDTPSPEPITIGKRYSVSPARHPLPKSREPTPPPGPAPTTIRERVLWLSLYFALNLALTLYNKFVLIYFPFPFTLSALHALCGVIGTHGIIHLWIPWSGGMGGATLREINPHLTGHEKRIVAAFSVLYAVNIVASNASLELVTVPFHQVVPATTPVFTLLLAPFLRLPTRISRARLVALVPVVIGVGVATYGDFYFTYAGLILTLVGTVLAALKTLITNLLQSSPVSVAKAQQAPDPSSPPSPILTSHSLPSESKLHSIKEMIVGGKDSTEPRRALHPFALLHVLSPLAFVHCALAAQFSGEFAAVLGCMRASENLPRLVLALLTNGAIAFGLNIVSFSANGKVGAVNMSVAANVKQVLTILLAVGLFNLRISGTNAVGIGLTLVGGAWYARVVHVERRR